MCFQPRSCHTGGDISPPHPHSHGAVLFRAVPLPNLVGTVMSQPPILRVARGPASWLTWSGLPRRESRRGFSSEGIAPKPRHTHITRDTSLSHDGVASDLRWGSLGHRCPNARTNEPAARRREGPICAGALSAIFTFRQVRNNSTYASGCQALCF